MAKPKPVQIPLKDLLLESFSAKLIEVFAVVSNEDQEEGRGRVIDRAYYAEEGAAKIGAMTAWRYGSVRSRYAMKFTHNLGAGGMQTVHLLLAGPGIPTDDAPMIEVLPFPTEKLEKLRQAAIKKLSKEEAEILGLLK